MGARQEAARAGGGESHISFIPIPLAALAARRSDERAAKVRPASEKHEMNRLSRITIAAIIGLQAIFWLAAFVLMKLTPQVTQDSQQTARATGAGNIIAVEMNDNLRFAPTEITIKAGDTVEWRNTGSVRHTVTADPGRAPGSKNIALPAGAETFDSGWVKGGQLFRYTFSEPGVYRYICLPHEGARMFGTVIVG